MKKRLSLLMVLMMVVSLLPMSAFADGKLSGVSTLNVTTDDKRTYVAAFEFEQTAAITSVTQQDLLFTLTGGAEFDGAMGVSVAGAITTVGPVVTNNVNATQRYVQTTADAAIGSSIGDKGSIVFTFTVDFDGAAGDVYLEVEDSAPYAAGMDTVGSRTGSNAIKLAVVGDASRSELDITVKDSEKTMSFDGGALSQFTVKNITSGTTQLVLEADKGVKWAAGTTVFATGDLNGKLGTISTNGEKLTIPFTGSGVGANSKGTLIITPEFLATDRKVTEGNVTVYAESTGTGVKTVTNRAVIGKVVDYSVTMTIVELNKKEIPNVWGGEEATVKVTLKGPKGSFSNRPIDFVADGTNIIYGASSPSLSQSAIGTLKANNGATLTAVSGDPDDDAVASPKRTVFADKEFSINGTKLADATEISFVMDIRTAGNKNGVATLTAAQRGWEVTADLAQITPKFVTTTEVTPVKKGEARDTADLTITEAKAGLLAKGDVITLKFDTKRNYVEFTTDDITVSATNGMSFDTKNGINYIKDGSDTIGLSLLIDKASYGDAAVITVSGLNVAVDGSTTDDVVQLITGLTVKNGSNAKVSTPDYIKVVKEYDLESILSVFTIGQTTYTVNGNEKSAASAPYIKEGRTMLPIRAVAESLGLTVQWNGATKTASFTDASKVAAVTIGAKVMYVNGTPMPLSAAAELVNDTTFVELRSLATAFGVQIDWDAAAKTATVSK